MKISDALQDAPADAVREVLRLAEAALDGTVQVALAADQRAITLAGICAAAAAAGAATAVALIFGEVPMHAAAAAVGMGALVLFFAALVFGYAARPVDFYVAGYEPRALVGSAKDFRWLMIYAAEDLQPRITKNRAVLERSARTFQIGYCIAALAPILAAAVYFMM